MFSKKKLVTFCLCILLNNRWLSATCFFQKKMRMWCLEHFLSKKKCVRFLSIFFQENNKWLSLFFFRKKCVTFLLICIPFFSNKIINGSRQLFSGCCWVVFFQHFVMEKKWGNNGSVSYSFFQENNFSINFIRFEHYFIPITVLFFASMNVILAGVKLKLI